MPAGTISQKTPWVRVDRNLDNQQWDLGHVRVYAPDCTSRGSSDIEPGTYSLVIDQSRLPSLTSIGKQADEFIPDLQPAAISCS